MLLQPATLALFAACSAGADEPTSQAREVALALSAGPPHFTTEAGVYVPDAAQGFVKVRESRNGFHCLVERSEPGELAPQCLDAEGSETVLPKILLMARLKAEGKKPAEIEAAVAEAYREGRLRAPRRPGVNYMLSRENRLPTPDGRGRPYPPHLMFYAPYLTNADLGVKAAAGAPTFVVSEGKPGAYIIVPVPSEGVGH